MKYEFCVARKSVVPNEFIRVGKIRQTLSSALRDRVKYERIHSANALVILKRKVNEWSIA